MKISNRDWVQLSAYLDGELSAREAKKLESRLVGEPGLKAAWEDLRRTKQILSRTPRLKIPRNFTLTTQQVRIKRARSAAVGYSWAAAVLSLLFITVVVIDLGTGSSKGALDAVVASRSEQILPEAAMEAAPADTGVEEPALLAEEESLESENAADQDAEPAQEAAAAAGEESVEEGLAVEGNLQGQATQDLAQEQAKAAPQETDLVGEQSGGEIASSDTQDEAEPTVTAAPSPEAEVESYYQVPEEQLSLRGAQPLVPWIRILEILLALGAAGFTITAWLKWRRRS